MAARRKTMGAVAYEAYTLTSWSYCIDTEEQDRWRDAARAVVREYKRREKEKGR